MRGNLPEEDGVEHRVGSQPWLADGAADGADAGPEEEQQPFAAAETPFAAEPPFAAQPSYTAETPFPDDAAYAAPPAYPAQPAHPAEPIGEADVPGSEHPNGNSAETGSGPARGDAGLPPPYPAQLPYPAQNPSGPGLAAKLKPSFLARSKTGAAKPAKPAKPERPPKGERSSKPMTARVTAPFQARPKPGAAKTARPPRTAAADAVPKGPVSTRKAQLVLSRIEPWSVMKFSFMVSLVGWVILFVAVTVLYFVLSKLGVFHAIQTTIGSVTSSKDSPGIDAGGGWFSASRVLGYTMLVGAVNVILITALATVAAVIYNLVTHIAGGIEVTLKETD